MVAQEPLVIATSSENGAGTLALAGEVDFGNVSQLRTALSQLIKTTAGDVTVDIHGVSFLDSTGLGVIIQAKKRLLERGDDLVVLNPQPRVLRIFEVAGLKEHLGV